MCFDKGLLCRKAKNVLTLYIVGRHQTIDNVVKPQSITPLSYKTFKWVSVTLWQKRNNPIPLRPCAIIFRITTVSLSRVVYHLGPYRLPYNSIPTSTRLYYKNWVASLSYLNVNDRGMDCKSVTRISFGLVAVSVIEKRSIYLNI